MYVCGNLYIHKNAYVRVLKVTNIIIIKKSLLDSVSLTASSRVLKYCQHELRLFTTALTMPMLDPYLHANYDLYRFFDKRVLAFFYIDPLVTDRFFWYVGAFLDLSRP